MTCIGELVLYSYSFCPSPGHVPCEVRWKYFHHADWKILTHLNDAEPTGVGFLFLTLYFVSVANSAASSALQLGNLKQPRILPVDATNKQGIVLYYVWIMYDMFTQIHSQLCPCWLILWSSFDVCIWLLVYLCCKIVMPIWFFRFMSNSLTYC